MAAHQVTWSLRLELVSSAGRPVGAMTLHRMYYERDLQLDVNLLTSQFPFALADALDRVLPEPGVSIMAPEATSGLRAARVS